MTKKPKEKDRHSPDKVPLLLRLEAADAKKLDALSERFRFASKTALAIEAMKIGLEELVRDPTALVRERK